jgi:DHA2 family multidrug resistance protein
LAFSLRRRSSVPAEGHISLSIAEIVRTSGANYSRMTEMITPYNRALTVPGMTGAWNFDTVPGLARVA